MSSMIRHRFPGSGDNLKLGIQVSVKIHYTSIPDAASLCSDLRLTTFCACGLSSSLCDSDTIYPIQYVQPAVYT